MGKKSALIIIVCMVIVYQATIAFAITTKPKLIVFKDVSSSDWYYQDVLKCKKLSILEGTGDNMFSPNEPITYAEYLTILTRIIDESVKTAPEGTNWYDKFIASARANGIISKTEKVPVNEAAFRQDMIKYTCKALGIQPSTSQQIVFNDVKSEDAAYINAAYNEYLTDGYGIDYSTGLRQFGFGKSSTRAELATMALRIQQYKQNPEQFKQERAIERQQDEQKYKDSTTRVDYNGYSITKSNVNHMVNLNGSTREGCIDIGCCVGSKANLDEAQRILASRWGDTVAKQAVDFVMTKTDKSQEIYKEINLGNKYVLTIGSTTNDNVVTIQVVYRNY